MHYSMKKSRALGDFQYKDEDLKAEDCKVSPAPETQSIERTDQDEFLIVACDGIWDVISNEVGWLLCCTSYV